jgi:hypothetical protein
MNDTHSTNGHAHLRSRRNVLKAGAVVGALATSSVLAVTASEDENDEFGYNGAARVDGYLDFGLVNKTVGRSAIVDRVLVDVDAPITLWDLEVNVNSWRWGSDGRANHEVFPKHNPAVVDLREEGTQATLDPGDPAFGRTAYVRVLAAGAGWSGEPAFEGRAIDIEVHYHLAGEDHREAPYRRAVVFTIPAGGESHDFFREDLEVRGSIRDD